MPDAETLCFLALILAAMIAVAAVATITGKDLMPQTGKENDYRGFE